MDKINELAKEMNVSPTDVLAFVRCLRVWVEKGYTFEQAIAKHSAQMNRLASHSLKLDAKALIVPMYDELREVA